MAEPPDFDPIAGLGNVDKTVCGVCGKKLTGMSFLMNINGQLMSVCAGCNFRLKKKK
jgi:ribosome-binding protein aMBF1 (putative translation factor)